MSGCGWWPARPWQRHAVRFLTVESPCAGVTAVCARCVGSTAQQPACGVLLQDGLVAVQQTEDLLIRGKLDVPST